MRIIITCDNGLKCNSNKRSVLSGSSSSQSLIYALVLSSFYLQRQTEFSLCLVWKSGHLFFY